MSVEQARIQVLCDKEPNQKSKYLLYWMQQSQRAEHNPALEHAVQLANDLNVPVLVGFGLHEATPTQTSGPSPFCSRASLKRQRAYVTAESSLSCARDRPKRLLSSSQKMLSLVVCDRGYLRHQRKWRRAVARKANCRLLQVEGDVVVPVAEVSDKAEYAARTIRPKIVKLQDDYLFRLRPTKPSKSSIGLRVQGNLDPA